MKTVNETEHGCWIMELLWGGGPCQHNFFCITLVGRMFFVERVGKGCNGVGGRRGWVAGSSLCLTTHTRMLSKLMLIEVSPLQNRGTTLHLAGLGKHAGVLGERYGQQTGRGQT